MAESSGSLGPFLEAYMNQKKTMQFQQKAHIPDSTDILELFSEKGVSSMSLLEIASDLYINKLEANRLSGELEKKKIVQIKEVDDNELYVELTRLGKQLLKD